MSAFTLTTHWRRPLAWLVAGSLAGCVAVPTQHPATNLPTRTASVDYVRTSLSQAEIEQTLAPIALYPNAVLAQILMAAGNPAEVAAAWQWLQAHPQIDSAQTLAAVASQSWDDSVKALVAFPRVLAMMSEQPAWTQRLGGLVAHQSDDVLAAIDDLRDRAYDAGTLADAADDVLVGDDIGEIDIGSAGSSNQYYLPDCDWSRAYGTWPWPDYAPAVTAAWSQTLNWRPCDWFWPTQIQPHWYRRYYGRHAQHHPGRPQHPLRGAVVWNAPATQHRDTTRLPDDTLSPLRVGTLTYAPLMPTQILHWPRVDATAAGMGSVHHYSGGVARAYGGGGGGHFGGGSGGGGGHSSSGGSGGGHSSGGSSGGSSHH